MSTSIQPAATGTSLQPARNATNKALGHALQHGAVPREEPKLLRREDLREIVPVLQGHLARQLGLALQMLGREQRDMPRCVLLHLVVQRHAAAGSRSVGEGHDHVVHGSFGRVFSDVVGPGEDFCRVVLRWCGCVRVLGGRLAAVGRRGCAAVLGVWDALAVGSFLSVVVFYNLGSFKVCLC